MKQIAKTSEVLGKLRAAYGADANLDDLAVYETTLANTQPLRKTGGIFKGARMVPGLMTDLAAAVNAESVPLHLMHNTAPLPVGRLFAAASLPQNQEARGLFAVDKVAHPDLVQKLDSGTIDQVSIGLISKHLNCSACGFDFKANTPAARAALWNSECENGHVLGQEGVHLVIAGVDTLFETSLVDRGAVNGARIVGPSESIFQGDHRLAASHADGSALAMRLSPTIEEKPVDLAALVAQLTEQTTARATADVNLTAMTAERDTLKTALAAAEAARDEAVTAGKEAVAHKATAEKAIAALKVEAGKILTAVGKADQVAGLTDDVDALIATIAEHREQLAALIPAGGVSNGSDADPPVQLRNHSLGAFRAPAR